MIGYYQLIWIIYIVNGETFGIFNNKTNELNNNNNTFMIGINIFNNEFSDFSLYELIIFNKN